ncbi:hypothetical protein ARMSODRAFT_553761 [Armillaria solidipes]|uniref:Uncharacterized protein n=1 Tax=Armillaria solidipes TaxID=1076256 RepID=A0A2H3BEU4_9AGAR|nr:hypothetical protein ARMSODRAFT_553761 [Armillaria solidipes]
MRSRQASFLHRYFSAFDLEGVFFLMREEVLKYRGKKIDTSVQKERIEDSATAAPRSYLTSHTGTSYCCLLREISESASRRLSAHAKHIRVHLLKKRSQIIQDLTEMIVQLIEGRASKLDYEVLQSFAPLLETNDLPAVLQVVAMFSACIGNRMQLATDRRPCQLRISPIFDSSFVVSDHLRTVGWFR